MFQVYEQNKSKLYNSSKTPPLFTGTDSSTTVNDTRMTRQGVWYLLANGPLSTSTTYGEVWFSYSLDLWLPHTRIVGASTTATMILGSGTTAVTSPLGTVQTIVGDFNPSYNATTFRIKLPTTGRWLIVWRVTAATSANTMLISALTGNTMITSSRIGDGTTPAAYFAVINVGVDGNTDCAQFDIASVSGAISINSAYIVKINNSMSEVKQLTKEAEIEQKMLRLQRQEEEIEAMAAKLKKLKRLYGKLETRDNQLAEAAETIGPIVYPSDGRGWPDDISSFSSFSDDSSDSDELEEKPVRDRK